MYEIASPLSFEVAKRIQQERQIDGDSRYRPLQLITGYNPRVFIADPDMGQPDPGDGAHYNLPSRAVGERE